MYFLVVPQSISMDVFCFVVVFEGEGRGREKSLEHLLTHSVFH